MQYRPDTCYNSSHLCYITGSDRRACPDGYCSSVLPCCCCDVWVKTISGILMLKGSITLLALLAALIAAFVASARAASRVRSEQTTLGGAEIKKVAIFPFSPSNAAANDQEIRFFSLALAAEIGAKLSQSEGVAARVPEGERYEVSESMLANAAHELDIEYSLTGSYRREGDRLRLNARLMNARRGETLWDAPLEVAYHDLRRIPELLCQMIIAGLGITLSPAEDSRLRKDRCADATAYELYLRATALRPATANDWQRQRELLERSIELDHAYAPALAALGNAHMQYASKTGGGARHYELAERILRRALKINGESPQTLLALGSLYAKIGKSEESAALLQRALRLFPHSASFHQTLGYVYRYAGLLDESIATYRQAQTLDRGLGNLIESEEQIVKALIYKGDYRAALASHAKIAAYRDAAREPPDHKELFYAGVSHLYLKEHGAAARLFDRAAAIDAVSIWSVFAQAYKAAQQGDRTRLLERVKKLETLDIVDSERRYRLAHFYALAGQRTPALHNLKKAIEGGFFNYPYLSHDPLLADISGADEFKTLLRGAKRRHENFKRKFGARRERS